MSMWLRQSTASQEVLLGRFVDSVNGDTEKVALTILNTDIKLWREGATTLANKNSGGATHIAGGLYSAVLDATDTATPGKLEVNVHVAGALAVRREFLVLPANVYDSLLLGTDQLQVDTVQVAGSAASATAGAVDANVTEVAGSAAAATNLSAQMLAQVLGSVNDAGAGATSFIGNSGLSTTDDEYNGQVLAFTSGTLAGVARKVSDYVGSTRTITLSVALPSAPANATTFVILGYLP